LSLQKLKHLLATYTSQELIDHIGLISVGIQDVQKLQKTNSTATIAMIMAALLKSSFFISYTTPYYDICDKSEDQT
jgi:hypothetical protein